jgi:hypothetical protein
MSKLLKERRRCKDIGIGELVAQSVHVIELEHVSSFEWSKNAHCKVSQSRIEVQTGLRNATVSGGERNTEKLEVRAE